MNRIVMLLLVGLLACSSMFVFSSSRVERRYPKRSNAMQRWLPESSPISGANVSESDAAPCRKRISGPDPSTV